MENPCTTQTRRVSHEIIQDGVRRHPPIGVERPWTDINLLEHEGSYLSLTGPDSAAGAPPAARAPRDDVNSLDDFSSTIMPPNGTC